MTNQAYCRIAGYTFTLLLHAVNCLAINNNLYPPKNEKLKITASLMWQYFTIWNIILQIAYALFGLTCDIFILKNGTSKMSKILVLREYIFGVVMWTSCCMVASFFWPLYLYDRDLIYPAYIDEGIPPFCNYIMHGVITLVILWEFCFLPRSLKISHRLSVINHTMVFITYFSWIIYSQTITGFWPYPFLKMLYGTIYFPMCLLVIYAVMLSGYFSQWPLVYLVWGRQEKKFA